MGELTIRRIRANNAAGYRGTDKAGKAEKTEGASQTRKAAAGFTVSESLRQRLTRSSQAESQYREGRRTLQAGEVVLSKVQDCLSRIADLARESAGGKEPDRAALQAELEHLQTEIDRMIRSASVGGVPLFLDGDVELDEGMETLLRAIMDGAEPETGQTLPDWLAQAVTQDGMTPEQILASLGLDKSASAADILKALAGRPLEGGSAAGRLAALYLGAVIAGSGGSADLDAALDGLRQLLEKVAGGTPPDEALQALTDGEFTSFADFQSQFTEGTAPDLEAFLVDLLLSDAPLLSDVPLLSGDSLMNLLSAAEGMDLELLMSLLTTTPSPAPEEAAEATLPPDGASPAPDGEIGAPPVPIAADGGTESPSPASPAPPASQQIGNVQAEGRDLSGVSLNAATGELTVGGAADVTIRGTEQQQPAVLITGTGTVTLRDVRAAVLTIAADARVFSDGGSVLAEVQLKENAALTLGGGGPVRIGVLRAGETNVIRLARGAVVRVESSSVLTAPVVLEGAASFAAQAANVRDLSGNRLQPFDILWKTLLPGWSGVTSLAVDGRQARLAPLVGSEPVRLWLSRGDSGYPAHTLVLRGRDASGRPRTRYAYLCWNRRTGAFEELSMYPNPFTVTGGESGRDWAYDEASHTLHILTPQVTAISGGAGTDANQSPFSGRIALADGIGALELTLGGVVCRVTSGRAFHLGRANDVTLLLQSGTSNLFESGVGCAGISLGDGTSLRIDAPSSPGGDAVGALTATGGAGGAGIGRDSGGSRDRTSRIVIRGGVITATGTGGGAGIGAGKHGYMGPVTISGGVVTSVGGTGGGAGIGGALGAPVGDISIRGGTVTATAANHAAAIGAGILGDSGDIRIDGTARIAKAVGGDPGADIGACLFGGCGNVFLSRGADIGSARLWDRISLQMGEEAVTLPQFRLSSRALQLNRLCLSTPEEARSARSTIEADRRWVSQIQAAYSVLYNRLGQSFSSPQNQAAEEEAPVRDDAAAGTLLRSTRQSILLQSSQALSGKRDTEDVRQLLR